ncbi:MAG: hypothetical protein J7L31_05660 [Thermoplasmata archaeon]|nr:hypothetical protein [Thermoplasmata archaeon]
MNEEKIKERALLLMRLYWKDQIYKIGKELGISYFNQFKDYWDIDHFQGAFEISKRITDDELLRIVEKNPPKYISLGGFYGKYYTVTEEGKIKLEGSWNLIRENVHKVLKNYGDKGYAILQAIINRGGRATYFEIMEEIEKILGRPYIPSYLLPRLQPLKLVFKTGSRRYPDWTMPPEIIPIVKEKLADYKKLGKKYRITLEEKIALEERTSFLILRSDRRIAKIADEIAQKRREINLIFANKFGVKLFKDNEIAILDIRKLCANEEEFNNRIQALTTLIDEINVKELKKFIRNKKLNGSVNILEAFLEEQLPNYNKTIIANLRNIITLRSKKYPIHRDDARFINALRYFGFRKYPPDWGKLWEVVLKKYLESLKLLKKCIEE